VVELGLVVAELALSRAGSLLQGIESGLGFGWRLREQARSHRFCVGLGIRGGRAVVIAGKPGSHRDWGMAMVGGVSC
jgi:hypothetical protein